MSRVLAVQHRTRIAVIITCFRGGSAGFSGLRFLPCGGGGVMDNIAPGRKKKSDVTRVIAILEFSPLPSSRTCASSPSLVAALPPGEGCVPNVFGSDGKREARDHSSSKVVLA